MHSIKTNLHFHAYNIEQENFNYLTKDYKAKRRNSHFKVAFVQTVDIDIILHYGAMHGLAT